MGRAALKKVLAVVLMISGPVAVAPPARAQNLDDIFRKVNTSVLVVRSKGRDVGAGRRHAASARRARAS